MRRNSVLVDYLFRARENYLIHHQTRQFFLDLYDPNKNGPGLNVTWNALQTMKQSQTSDSKRFIVVIFPMLVQLERGYPLAEIHQRLVASLQRLEVEFIDLLPMDRKYPTSTLIVHPVDRHPNDLAHRLAAEAITEYLSQSNKSR
jgi:hypothetical protein